MLRIDSRIARGNRGDHLKLITDFFIKALSSQFEAKEIEEAWIGKLTTETKKFGFDTWSIQLQPIDHDIPECIKPMIDGYLLNLTDALLIAEPDLPKIDYHCAEIKKPELLTREIFSRLAKKMFCKSISSDKARRLLIVFKEFSALLNASPALKKYSLLDQALSLVMSRQGTFTALNRILLKDEEWVTQFEQGIEFSATVNANHAAVKHAIAHTQDRLHILKIQLAGVLAAELGLKVSPANCSHEYIDPYLNKLNESFEKKKTKSEHCLAKIKTIVGLKKEMEEIQTALSKFQTLLDLTGWVIILMDIFDVEQLAKLVDAIDGKIELIDAGVVLSDEKRTQDNGYLQALTDHKKTSHSSKIRSSANCAQELRKLRSLKVQKEVLKLFTASITALHNSSLMMEGELVKFINTHRFEELQGWVPPIKKISQYSQELPLLSSPMQIAPSEDSSVELTALSTSSSLSFVPSSPPASLQKKKKLSNLPSYFLLGIDKDALIGKPGSLFDALAEVLAAAQEDRLKYSTQSLQRAYDAYHKQHSEENVENPLILLCRYFEELPCIQLIEISNDPDSKKEEPEKAVTHSLVTGRGVCEMYAMTMIDVTIPTLILDKDTEDYTPILSTIKKSQLTHKHAGQKQGNTTSSRLRSSPFMQRTAAERVRHNISLIYPQQEEPLMSTARQGERQEEETKTPLMSTAGIFESLTPSSSFFKEVRKRQVTVSYPKKDFAIFFEIQQILNKELPTDRYENFNGEDEDFINENAAKQLDDEKFCNTFHRRIQHEVLVKYEKTVTRDHLSFYSIGYTRKELSALKRHQARLKAALYYAQKYLQPFIQPGETKPLSVEEILIYKRQLEYVDQILIGALGRMSNDLLWHEGAHKLYYEKTKDAYTTKISEISPKDAEGNEVITVTLNLTDFAFRMFNEKNYEVKIHCNEEIGAPIQEAGAYEIGEPLNLNMPKKIQRTPEKEWATATMADDNRAAAPYDAVSLAVHSLPKPGGP